MKLSTVQTDAIQELANIGAAHAATTLSPMLGSTVKMSVPGIKMVDISQLGPFMDEESAAMMAFELQGEIQYGGYIIFYISHESAIRLTNTMLELTERDQPMNEMDKSTLHEVGNIMVSLFLDATAELLGFIMLASPPALSIDMAHAAMQSLIARSSNDMDEALLLSTELMCQEHKIDSDLIMMPEHNILKKIVALLENMMGAA